MGVENNISNEWSESTLGDLITHKKGFAFKSKDYSKNGRKIVKVKDFTSNSIDDTECDFISEELAESFSDYELKHKDVVIQTVGSWPSNPASIVGKVVRVPQKVEGALLNQNAVKLNSTKNVDNDFLFYSLIYKRFKSHLISRAQGSANQASITLKDIFDYELNLPPISEQKDIAKVLTAFDEKIELLQAQNKTLETMAQTIFKDWFGKYQIGDELPEGWRVGKIGDLTEIKRGGSPRPIKDYISDSGYRWLKISDATATDSPYIFKIKEHIKIEGLKKTTLKKAGELVLSNSATPGMPKFLAVDTCIHDGWMHFNNSVASNEYFYLLFLYIRPRLIQQGSGSVFVNLKTDILREFEITIPTKSVFTDFDTLIKPIFDKIYNNAIQIQSLKKTRDTLLPKLMSGQVRVKV
jgi:type I restriction enzyme S subunit